MVGHGREWKKWTTGWNITPKFTTAYHPQANGMVERYNASLKKTIHATIAEGKDPKKAVRKFTYAYRNTPHTTTGEKSSKLFFNRDINEKIPTPTKKPKGKHHDDARRKIKTAKESEDIHGQEETRQGHDHGSGRAPRPRRPHGTQSPIK